MYSWNSVKAHRTLVIQTVRGPVAIKAATTNSEYIRGYAPAFISTTSEGTKVAFLPVGFAEEYIDFRINGIMGTNPLPEALVDAYEDYVDNFIKGAYRLKTVAVQIDAEEVPVSVTTERTEEVVAVTQ